MASVRWPKKHRPELRSILGFSLPMSVANYVQQSYLLADSIIVGHYVGIEGLAAVGAGQPIFYLVNAVFLGLVSGFAIRFARMTGSGRAESQQDAVVGLAAFAVVWAVLCMALIFTGTGFLLNAMGIHGTIADGSTTYLRTLSLGFVGMFGIGALGGFLRGLGDSRTVMYIMVFSSLLNIVLAWSFVALLGWGLRGAALGTVAASCTAFVAGLVLVARRHGIHRYRSSLPQLARQAGSSLRLGFPVGIQHVMLSLGSMVLTSLIAPFGTAAIAALSIAARLEALAGRFYLDLSGAVTVFVAQHTGGGDAERARRVLLEALRICLWATLAESVLVILLRHDIAAAFTTDPSVRGIVASYILMTYPFFLLYTAMAVVHGFLNGIGRTVFPLVCTMLSFLVFRVPTASLLKGPLGLDGLIWAVPIGWFVGLAYTAFAVRRYIQDAERFIPVQKSRAPQRHRR
ncbi:MATE family efflux transporter [Streptomyces fulvoviolaceus]|uniref:MATE family efflux transporter n=1 Tax=Streptomyces fulvoviolaceus TaxID=285535 RepID=UPI0021BDF08E|nr:MATE family efflux transporter [Streptomyces fulvoviolaceus]MCT9077576.1 MATE family efflux transporter [Streptomyces fulvoviolaceus]